MILMVDLIDLKKQILPVLKVKMMKKRRIK
jgi:hypothetical protein